MNLLKLYIALIVFSIHFVSQGQSTWVAPDSANSVENPIAENDEALISGKTAFEAICFVCHGNQGKGDGLNAPNLERPPADLTAATVQAQSDGALFWKISEGNPPMLSFRNSLSEERRWQLVHYIRELARLYPPEVATEPSAAKSQEITSGQSNTNEFTSTDSTSLLSSNKYLITVVFSVLVVVLITLVVLVYTLLAVTVAVKN